MCGPLKATKPFWRVSTSLARENENVNRQSAESTYYETFIYTPNASCFMRLKDRELNFLFHRHQETRGPIKEASGVCQNVLGEVEPLVSELSEHNAKRIREVLQRLDSGYVSSDLSNGNTFRSTSASLAEVEKPPSSPSSVGSLEALDQIQDEINLTEQSRATGHIGKSSEVTWIQRLQQAADERRRESARNAEAIQDGTICDLPRPHNLNYHFDDLDIMLPEPVERYWVPPRPLADKLFKTYLLVAHP